MPYSQYLVPTNRSESIRNLQVEIYKSYPNARDGMTIAGNFMKTAYSSGRSSRRTRLLDSAQTYLVEAQALLAEEGEGDKASQSYVATRYWEAYTIGGLANFGRGDYRSQYQQKYEDLLSFLKNEGGFDQKRWIPITLWRYGVFTMIVHNDNEKARALFTEAVQAIGTTPTPQSSNLVALLKSFNEEKENGNTSRGVRHFDRAAALSPEFKALVDGI